jgi:hypothetical protein
MVLAKGKLGILSHMGPMVILNPLSIGYISGEALMQEAKGIYAPLQKLFALRRGFRPDFFDNLAVNHTIKNGFGVRRPK